MIETKALRAKILDIIFEKTGKKVTITDIISLAVIRTLMKHKYVNSSLTEDGNQIILHNYVNLAIAVGMDSGVKHLPRMHDRIIDDRNQTHPTCNG